MKTDYIILLAILVQVFGENCDKLGILLYEDLGCTPVMQRKNSCPTKFICQGLELSPKCYYQGRSYEIGSVLEMNRNGLSCEFSCFCTDNSNKTDVSCAKGSCASYARPPNNGCYYTYNLQHCCSEGESCELNPFKCVVDGVEFREGERFVPQNTCNVCLCQKGFRGRIEAPFCTRKGCDVQLKNQDKIQNSCAPVYFKDTKCCPETWTCYEGDNIQERKKCDILGDQCRFGSKFLNIGDKFQKNITYMFKMKQVNCECKIPPLVTCVDHD